MDSGFIRGGIVINDESVEISAAVSLQAQFKVLLISAIISF